MKNNIKKRNNINLLSLLFFFIATMASMTLIVGLSIGNKHAYVENNIEVHHYFSNKTDSVYLSDIEYIKGMSYVGWDEIRYDQVNDGSKISLKIEGSAFTFDKGIWAHATSQITYDISSYDYKYFTAFVGINTTSSRGDGVKFEIVTSEDGATWSKPKYEEVKLPQQEATFVKIDVTNVKYIILTADDLNGNASDHAVYADAKLTNEEESYVLKSVDEYNKIIKAQYNNQNEITGELESNLLKKELVQNVGQYTINSFYNESEDNKAVIDWLMSNPDALRYYILGGKPEGSYYNSLTQLSRLYRNYKEDFENKEVTQFGTVLGDLYTRMAISLSLTHAKVVGLWMQSGATENKSDAVRRYAIYKYMHANGYMKALDNFDVTKWFENYTIEEMRFVMNNNIDDEEILWLNRYTQERVEKYKSTGYLTPHSYIAYVYPNYGNPIYYDEANKDYFNDLFSIPDEDNEGERIGLWDVSFTIPGGKDVPEYTIKITRGTSEYKLYKVWMNMRNKFGTGSVCGGISKTGSNIRGAHGIPSAVIGQPGHAAIIYYTQDANGDGYWNLDNDVSGWAYSEKGERMLLGWGNASFSRGYSVVYMALAQEVINDNDKFEQSEKFVYLADTYKDDLVKKEEAYRKALDIQPLNIDAWYGLITLYNESSDKTEEDYYNLAEELAESLKYFPLPMTHLSNLIKPHLTSVEYSYRYTLLQTRILTEASVVPNNTANNYYVYQPSLTRLMGNFLLGSLDKTIATFSFDGENANKIVLSSRFDSNGVRWDYSIDGKKTWKEVSFTADEEHKWQLTDEEIAAITSENDLYIHIVGVNYDENNLYKIDIKESAGLPSTLFASDLENKLLGAVDSIEWKYNENDEWKKYGDEKPVLTGDKMIILRMGAIGTYLTSNNSVTYTFTEDVVNNQRKYIPVEHISLVGVSTEATNQQGNATFALDANYNTRWHSAWNGSDTQRFITVKLDDPRNISAVEFVPAGGGNGKIYDGTVWGSMDGENWFIISQKKNLTYKNQANTVAEAIANIKSFDVDVPQRVQYVKIVADRTNGNWITARAFNFYEDTTIKIVANFSFDGKNAGEISLIDSEYTGIWKYSLDGGATWKLAEGNKHQLTKKEMMNITSENGIKVNFPNDDNVYTIRLKEAEEFKISPYVNDLENRLLGITDVSKLEWKLSSDEEWKDYADSEPVVKGDKTLQVRLKATGITLPSNVLEFNFTDDNQPDEMRYVPISHLSVHAFSNTTVPSRGEEAHFSIDGLPTTMWHTNRTTTTMNDPRWIIIKLDEPKSISKIQYVRKSLYQYGILCNGIVSISMDGESWEEAASFENLFNISTLDELKTTEDARDIIIDNPKEAQYIKIELTKSYDYLHGNRDGKPMDYFFSAAMFNLFEDITSLPAPTAEIEYSTTESTNQDVTARLVNSSTEIEITNNNGKDTYTFTENGEFTFKFKDKNGIEGEATAKVDWIIKTLPTVTVEYSTESSTNQDVIASISFDRDKTRIVDEKGNTIKTLALGEKYTVTFTENGSKEVKFVGPYGNASSTIINVDWIDREAPVGTITYSTTTLTNKDVVATLTVNEDITIINNGGSDKYTFKGNDTFTFRFTDKAGNEGEAIAKVDWIDRNIAMPTITYDINKPTRENVTASVTFDKDKVKILDDEGNIIKTLDLGEKYTITFTENGTHKFKYVGPAGNEGVATAKVDWIDREVPEATISYNSTDITNQDVTATIEFDEENVTILNNGGSNEYTFIENGTFVFEFVDEAGNKGTIPAVVSVIDKVAPTAKVEYSTTYLTNKDVVATIKDFSEEVTIINNKGSNKYTFTENGEFEFEIQDRAGNVTKVIAKVDNIDKIVPTAKVEYSTTDLTNKDVVATIKDFSEEVTIINNNGSDKYTFTENGEFEFEIQDKAGNVSKIKAKVDNIDKVAPTAKVEYSTTDLTNKDVVATIKDFSEEVTIINNNGSDKYTFTENGEFEFEIQDKAGNVSKIKAIVNNINKNISTVEIEYSTKDLTNKDVVVTITSDDDITIINNGGSNKYTFTENGEFKFEYINKYGVKGSTVAKVTWIDKVDPTAKVEYNITTLTNKDVVVTIKDFSEEIIILNNDGNNTYTFTDNDEFKFEFKDKAGNVGSVTAKVDWIDKIAPTAKVEYSINEVTDSIVIATIKDFSEDVTLLNNAGINTYVFNQNGSFVFEFVDKAGNKGTVVAKVTWIHKEENKDDEVEDNENNNGTGNTNNSEVIVDSIKPTKPSSNNESNDTIDKNEENDNTNSSVEKDNTDEIESEENSSENNENHTKKNYKFIIVLIALILMISLGIYAYKNRKSTEEE